MHCDECEDYEQLQRDLDDMRKHLRRMADRIQVGQHLTPEDERMIVELAWDDSQAMRQRERKYWALMQEVTRPLREAEARAKREAEAWSWAHEAHTRDA